MSAADIYSFHGPGVVRSAAAPSASIRTYKMKAISTYALLLLVLLFSAHVGHAQHWSYGLRPGGKRDAESLQDMYPETPNEVPLFPELERLECSVPQSRLNVLRGALMSWLDGENRKKI
uniref:Progonadoliberin n=1 Tax=Xenopus tropicalis TaxID=8364 RepID=F6TQV9_XENTR